MFSLSEIGFQTGLQWQNHNVNIPVFFVLTKPVKAGCTTSLEATDILVGGIDREIIGNWINVFVRSWALPKGSLL